MLDSGNELLTAPLTGRSDPALSQLKQRYTAKVNPNGPATAASASSRGPRQGGARSA